MAGLRHCGDSYITLEQSFMVHSSQAAGDLQLALRGGGDRRGRVGGRQAGLAGQVPEH